MENEVELKDWEQLLKDSHQTIKQTKLVIQINENLVALAETNISRLKNAQPEL